MGERIKVLITVKTYPLPSAKYGELVCTAGVREDGSFVRLYPIDYRSRPYWQWYKKYQWVELEVEKHIRDPRPESFRPIGEITLGQFIDTKNKWAKRKQYVLARAVSTMCGLQKEDQKEVSLGIIRPKIVKDFTIEETEREWKPEWIEQMRQLRLFDSNNKTPLERIPYKFSYRFTCEEPGCNGHKMMIEDWEVGQLYRSMRDKYDNDEKLACDKVKDKFYRQICAADKDTHFFVGTILEHGTWVILGTFWPKKEMT